MPRFLPPRSAPSCPPSFQTTGRYPCNRKYRIRYPPSGMQTPAEPDDIGSQLFYFVKMTDHAFQISDAVPVGILKTLRINLISDRFVPPLFSPLLFSCSFVFVMRTVGFRFTAKPIVFSLYHKRMDCATFFFFDFSYVRLTVTVHCFFISGKITQEAASPPI